MFSYLQAARTDSHLTIPPIKSGGVGGVQEALTALASTGCEIAITELDIPGAAVNDYVAVLQVCLNTPSCVSITNYRLSDASGGSGSLFDQSYKPKAAFNALLSALGASDAITTTDTSTSIVKPPSSNSDSLK